MSRIHPFDYAFGAVADEWFDEIAASAATSPRDASDFAAFARLPAVERLLQELRPEGPDPAAAEATEEYLRLLYAGFYFRQAGRKTIAVAREELERQIAAEEKPLPHLPQAAYCQLPERWFWATVSDASPHEPLDGFFVIAGGRAERELLIVAVLGLRAGREGFSQISVTAAPEDVVAAESPRQPRFAPAMEGGKLAGFHSVTSIAELLLLVRLALVSAAT